MTINENPGESFYITSDRTDNRIRSPRLTASDQ